MITTCFETERLASSTSSSRLMEVFDFDFLFRIGIRWNRVKQPQQRYSDADLYKPRPVITPSSRRSRRNSQGAP